MQDYKSMCAAVTICATFVNIQTRTGAHTHTHTHTEFDQLIRIALTELKMVQLLGGLRPSDLLLEIRLGSAVSVNPSSDPAVYGWQRMVIPRSRLLNE